MRKNELFREYEGRINGINYKFDGTWFNAMVLVKCPNNSTISYTESFASKKEMPRRGDRVKLKKGRFSFEVK